MESKETASPRDLTEAPASQLTAQLEKSQVPSNDLFQNSIEHLRVRKPCADSITIPKDTGSSARYATPVQTHFPTYKDELRPLNLPATPVKGDRPGQGLTLQVPQRVVNAPSNPFNRVPASPKVDAVQTYTSPSSVLPRRSRGLDFSRASTNLHHSTLAEASPDSSPVVGGRGVTIPHRRSIHGCVNASPSNSHGHMWSASGYNERNMISSSVSSINLLDSESSSCSDEDADASPNVPEGVESAAVIPQLAKTVQDPTNTLKPSLMQRPTTEWMHNASISKPSLMNFQRARYRGRTRHSSTSTSANSSGASPGPRSPSMAKSIETFPSGYFSNEVMVGDVRSRRESLSLGTSDLQLSDMSDEESKQGGNNSFNGATNPELTRRGVIRRAVTRRGNLLPKSKNFARIKADLVEECAPIESEAKKEAEVIRQVRESDSSLPRLSTPLTTSTMALHPVTTKETGSSLTSDQPASTNFSRQVSANSGGVQFWNSFDRRYQTPPPSIHSFRDNQNDMVMDTPPNNPIRAPFQAGGPALSQPRPLGPQAVLSQAATDLSQRLSKRRRVDDLDLDLASFKRRAVSPATSAQSSPSQNQAFSFSDNGLPGHVSKAKFCPGSSQGTIGTYSQPIKRVGLQNMNEASEGFMNMSID